MIAVTFWELTEAQLAASPPVLASLRPGASQEDLSRWSEAVGGSLPPALVDLYAGHDGADRVSGGGFSFIGEAYFMPIDTAIERHAKWQAEGVGVRPLIPFAVDLSGCYLAAAPGEGDELYYIFDDAAPTLYNFYSFPPSIDGLLEATIDGLRGQRPDYRAELTEQQLAWINLEEEADDLGN